MNDKEYISLYYECNGNLDEMIEKTGYGKGTIVTRCKRLNLRFRKIRYSQKKRGTPTKGKYLNAFLIDDIFP